MACILAPSILAADFKELGRQIRTTEENGAAYLHFDVMDGMFVPSISFGMPVLASIQGAGSQVMDVHLMVQEPIRYVEDFAAGGADIITVHLEACNDVEKTLRRIRELGKKAGLSIKPGTPVEKAAPWLPMIDMLLIMTVEPGFGGQKYIPASTDRIREAARMIAGQGLSVDVEVDGGITRENLSLVLDAGANVIVAGSAVFKGDIADNVRHMMEIMNRG